MPRKFEVATAAGTFDHFHEGHEQFLRDVFNIADTIYIGITSDAFAKSKKQLSEITPFVDRKKDVESYLSANDFGKRAHIIELDDIYGPTLDPICNFEAIIVTENTRYGAELINKLRKQKGLPSLVIEQVAYLIAKDGGDLSSSRIRAGEIDRGGNSV